MQSHPCPAWPRPPRARPAAGLDHCRRQPTPTIVWKRCPQEAERARAGLAIAGWTRHQAIPRVAGPAFLFCACVASVGWARLSGAARFAGVELVTEPTRHQCRRERPAEIPAGGASLVSRLATADLVVVRRRRGWDRVGHGREDALPFGVTSRPAETWAPTAATASGVLRRRAIRWSLIRSERRAGRHGRGRAGTGLPRAALGSGRGPAAARAPGPRSKHDSRA
jgi:hypothetical protein